MQKESDNILTRYKKLYLQRNMLKSMLARLDELTEEDVILSMNYEKLYGEAEIHKCIPSNQTQHIAITYREKYRMRYETELRECYDKLIKTDKELSVIESAIKQLPERYQKFIQLIVIEEETWETTAKILFVTTGALAKWKKKSIALIEKYCAFIDIWHIF